MLEGQASFKLTQLYFNNCGGDPKVYKDIKCVRLKFGGKSVQNDANNNYDTAYSVNMCMCMCFKNDKAQDEQTEDIFVMFYNFKS